MRDNMAVKFDPPAWWVMKEKAQVFLAYPEKLVIDTIGFWHYD